MTTKNFQEMSPDELLDYCREKRKAGVPYYTLDHFFKHHHIDRETVRYVVAQLDAEERKPEASSGPLPKASKRRNLRWVPPVVQGIVGFVCLVVGFSLLSEGNQNTLAGLFLLVAVYGLFKALKNFIKLN